MSGIKTVNFVDKDVLLLGTGSGSLMTAVLPLAIQGNARSITIVVSHARHRGYVNEAILNLKEKGACDVEFEVVDFDNYLDVFLSSPRMVNPVRSTVGDMVPLRKAKRPPVSRLNPVCVDNAEEYCIEESDGSGFTFRVFDMVFDSVAFDTDEYLSHMQFVRPFTGSYWQLQSPGHDDELHCPSQWSRLLKQVSWFQQRSKKARKECDVRKLGVAVLSSKHRLTRGSLYAARIVKPIPLDRNVVERTDEQTLAIANGEITDMSMCSFPIAVDREYDADVVVSEGGFDYLHRSDPYYLHENILVHFADETDFDPVGLEALTGLRPCYPFRLDHCDQDCATVGQHDGRRE